MSKTIQLAERKGKNEQFMKEILEESLALVEEGKVLQLVVILEREGGPEGTKVQIKRTCKSILEMHGLMAFASKHLLDGN